MARMIDGDKLVENLRLIATCWSISPFVSKEKHNGAVNMLREVEREVKEAPLLTPPNEPLTLDKLREMDGEPVYVSVSGMEILTMWALIEYIPESRSIVLTNNLGGRSEYFDDDDIKSDGITIYRRPLTKMEANENG